MNRRSIAPLACALLIPLTTLACGPRATDEAVPETGSPAPSEPAAAPAAEAVPASASAPAAEAALLDPNAASREEILALPHLDAATADALIAGRPYADMLAVDAVLAKTLDESAREEVYRALFKPLDLNQASGEEILLIPGVGERMRHELEEYRPYRAIAQFRREIGKYVDDAEVARIERYVVVR